MTFGLVGEALPHAPRRFWLIIAGAGVAQILGTVALLRAFDLRDFAIGTVYAKTEVILVAIVSAVALSEPVLFLGWIADRRLPRRASPGSRHRTGPQRAVERVDPAALMGVLAAAGFASPRSASAAPRTASATTRSGTGPCSR